MRQRGSGGGGCGCCPPRRIAIQDGAGSTVKHAGRSLPSPQGREALVGAGGRTRRRDSGACAARATEGACGSGAATRPNCASCHRIAHARRRQRHPPPFGCKRATRGSLSLARCRGRALQVKSVRATADSSPDGPQMTSALRLGVFVASWSVWLCSWPRSGSGGGVIVNCTGSCCAGAAGVLSAAPICAVSEL